MNALYRLGNQAERLMQLPFLNQLFALAGTLLVCTVFYFIYQSFHLFDWGHPFTKVMCFAIATAMIVRVYLRNKHTDIETQQSVSVFEGIAAVALISLALAQFAPNYMARMKDGPWVDIGYTTQNSAIMLFKDGENPYEATNINVRPELANEHRGFHYGPAMLVAYAASAYWPNVGYKVTSYVFFILTLGTMIMLYQAMCGHREYKHHQIASALLLVALYLMPERFWMEVFQQGANDIMAISLLLLGLLLFHHRWLFFAGFLFGFSFAAKFSPAVFLIFLFLRRDISWKFIIGGILGATPLWVFLAWNPMALIENVFILRATLGYDSTSLYSITPTEIHFLFPWIQLLAVIYFVKINFTEKFDLEKTLLHFTILLVIIEVTFKELHANHLIWFYPLFALLAVKNRHSLLSSLPFSPRPKY